MVYKIGFACFVTFWFPIFKTRVHFACKDIVCTHTKIAIFWKAFLCLDWTISQDDYKYLYQLEI